MTRFVLPKSFFKDPVLLTGPYHQKISRVLRMKVGELITLLDGEGGVWEGRIMTIDSQKTEIAIESRSTVSPSKTSITLVQALPKGKRFETVLEKGTELGVQRIAPVITARTVVRPPEDRTLHKHERWQEIIRHAAEQSNQAWLPKLEEVATLPEWVKAHQSREGFRIVCYEKERARRLREIWPKVPPSEVIVIIGPEGGFDPDEISMLTRSGFSSVWLGPLVLRTDTVPLVVISLIQFLAGEVG